MRAEVVLVDAWQQECCGDEVRVGDVVTWRLSRDVDREHVARGFGEDAAARATAVEQRHDERPDEELVTGRVTGVLSATCLLQPVPGRWREHESVPGSARVERRYALRRREEVAQHGAHWSGYVVELAVDEAR